VQQLYSKFNAPHLFVKIPKCLVSPLACFVRSKIVLYYFFVLLVLNSVLALSTLKLILGHRLFDSSKKSKRGKSGKWQE